jgi:hypothetical protein
VKKLIGLIIEELGMAYSPLRLPDMVHGRLLHRD